MLALYACNIASEDLLDSESLFAFMDDIYVTNRIEQKHSTSLWTARCGTTRGSVSIKVKRNCWSGPRGVGQVDGRSPHV